MYTKLIPETVYYITFTSKFTWNHLHLFIISAVYFLQLDHHTDEQLVHSKTINIRGDFIYKCPLGFWYTSV